MDNLEPITRNEMFLNGDDLEPITREEMILAGADLEPITRHEWFLKRYRGGGGGGGYDLVNIPNLPADIASFNDGTDLPMASLKVAVTPYQDLSHGDPSPENICPIIGWDEAVVTRCGKNLWGGEKLADDIVAKVPQASKDTTNKTVTYHASQITQKVLFDNFKENTQYTIYLSTSSQYTNIGISYADGSSETIDPNTYKTTLANKTVTQVVGRWASGSTVLKYEECGIFEGVVTASDFVPYNGATYTIDLDGTRYGGVVDATNGVMTVDRAYIDMGDLNYTYEGTSTPKRFSTTLSPSPKVSGYVICSAYKGTQKGAGALEDGELCLSGTSAYPFLRVRDDAYTDATAFKQAMNGVQLVYELANPITVQLSPTQVKSLEGVNKIYANCGQITEGKYFKRA